MRFPPQAFRVRVGSASQPGRTHLVVRDQEGAIHHDGCPGFDYRGRCRHVDRAVAETDQPLRTLLADLVERRMVNTADGDPDQLAEAIRMMDEAKVRMAARLAHMRYTESRSAMTQQEAEADAVRRFTH